MDYIANVLLSWSYYLAIFTFLMVVWWLYIKKDVKKVFLKVYLPSLLLTLIICAATSSNTGKLKTDYNKVQDVKSIQLQESYEVLEPIVDKTLKPKMTSEERSDKFEKLVDYKEKAN